MCVCVCVCACVYVRVCVCVWRGLGWGAGFMAYDLVHSHTLGFPFSNRIYISLTRCLMYFLGSFRHKSKRKATEKIAKLKFEIHRAGCLCPVWWLLSAVCASEDCHNYINVFCDWSTNRILLPNENEVKLSLPNWRYDRRFENNSLWSQPIHSIGQAWLIVERTD